MDWNKLKFHPLMGEDLTIENSLVLDFTAANQALKAIDPADIVSFDAFVFGKLEAAGKTYGIGGYLEKRAFYSRSEVFATQESTFRDIHLGVDIWAQPGTPVFVPFEGVVHSFQDNAGLGNYGPTIIMEHDLDGQKLYSLYGHLARTDLDRLAKGLKFHAGEHLCHIGPHPENGDWPAHLHFQLIWDLQGNEGDYPGVAAERDLEFYKKNCPDPNLVLRCQLL